MDNVAGPPVSAGNFFNRDREVADIWEQLRNHSLALLAPRRVGKTSILWRIRDRADERGHAAIYADIAGARDELEIVDKLHAAIAEHDLGTKLVKAAEDALAPLRQFKKLGALGVTVELEAAPRPDYRPVGSALLATLSKLDKRNDKPWIILLDELPVFLLRLLRTDGGRERAHEFLLWLRSLRTMYSQLHWVFAGSVGLTTVTERMRLSGTIDDLHVVRIGPFEPVDAQHMLEQLAVSYDVGGLDKDVCDHMLERLQWLVPYHVQLLFMKLRQRTGPGRPSPTTADVDAAYREVVAERTHFAVWRHRLLDSLGEVDGQAALRLLDQVARGGRDGATTEALRAVLRRALNGEDDSHGGGDGEQPLDGQLGFLLDVLRGDGYLASEDGRHRFRSRLLRDFWRRRLAP